MKMLALFSLALALVILQGQAQAVAPILNVALTEQTPYPASPGETMSIEVEIQNSGYDDALDNVVEINLNDPFTLQSGQEKIRTFNRIPARGSIKTTYTLDVSKGASSGQYDVDFLIYNKGDGAGNAMRPSVSVTVRGTPQVILESFYTAPEDIAPGDVVNVTAVFRNVGTGAARKTEASMTSTTTLVPILSGGKYYVGDIAPGETRTASMQINVDSGADYGIYQIPLTASYYDESNTASSALFSPGIPVRGSINLQIITIEPSYSSGLLKIEIANKGTADAEALECKLMIGNRMIGVEYLSALKATKKTTLSFPIVLKGQGKLQITYRGPGTEQNAIEKDISLDFQQVPAAGGSETLIAIVVIVLAVIGFVVWRKLLR